MVWIQDLALQWAPASLHLKNLAWLPFLCSLFLIQKRIYKQSTKYFHLWMKEQSRKLQKTWRITWTFIMIVLKRSGTVISHHALYSKTPNLLTALLLHVRTLKQLFKNQSLSPTPSLCRWSSLSTAHPAFHSPQPQTKIPPNILICPPLRRVVCLVSEGFPPAEQSPLDSGGKNPLPHSVQQWEQKLP